MTAAEQLVYEALIERHGHHYADRWLRDKGIAKEDIPPNSTTKSAPIFLQTPILETPAPTNNAPATLSVTAAANA